MTSEASIWRAIVGWSLMSCSGLLLVVRSTYLQAAASGEVPASFKAASKHGSVWDDQQLMEQALTLVLLRVADSQIGLLLGCNFMASVYVASIMATKAVFLGTLSSMEALHCKSKMLRFLALKAIILAAAWSAISDSALWLPWLAAVLYLKLFGGLAHQRFHSLMASPTATMYSHLRTVALLTFVLGNNASWAWAFIGYSSGPQTLSHRALWLFDNLVIAIEAAQTAVTYSVHMLQRWQEQRAEAGKVSSAGVWAQNGVAFHLELGLEVLSQVLMLGHILHVWQLHGLTCNSLDAVLFLDMRSLAFGLAANLRKHARYCSSTWNLRHKFRDADPAHLQRTLEECVVCRDVMQTGKVLPCGHTFHLTCLRAWLAQQGADNFTCPICRYPLFSARGGTETSQQGIARQPAFWTPQALVTRLLLWSHSSAAARQRQAGQRQAGAELGGTADADRPSPRRQQQGQQTGEADQAHSSSQQAAGQRRPCGNSDAEHPWHRASGQQPQQQQDRPAVATALTQQPSAPQRASGLFGLPWRRRQHRAARRDASGCQVQAVQQVLPHASRDAILTALERHGDPNRAVESLLCGG